MAEHGSELYTSESKYLSALRWMILPALLSALLIISSYYNFLLFHTLAELFPVMVAVIMFIVAWHTCSFTRNHFLLYIGCGYFWVAALDIMHALAYKGVEALVYLFARGAFAGRDYNGTPPTYSASSPQARGQRA